MTDTQHPQPELSDKAVFIALIVLNFAAEFVSFSAVIERVPPLRWFDRLGRPHRPAAL